MSRNDQSQNPLPPRRIPTWAERKANGQIHSFERRQWDPTRDERADARREEIEAGYDSYWPDRGEDYYRP